MAVSIAALAAYDLSHYSQHYWLLWTALSLALINLGETCWHRMLIILLTGVGIAVAVFAASGVSFILVLSACLLLVVTMLVAYFSQRSSDYFYPLLIINLFTLIAGSFPASLPIMVERSAFIFAGTGIAAGLQLIFWPGYLRQEIQSLQLAANTALTRLNDEMFSCLLQLDYVDNVYLYERRLHVRKNQFMRLLVALRKRQRGCGQLASDIKTMYVNMLRSFDALFACMLESAALRWRISDHTVLGVCADELNAIQQEMTKVFGQIAAIIANKKSLVDVDLLEEKIQYFEDNYQSVLQVTAKEPLVFLLFIGSLKNFCQIARSIKAVNA